MAPNASHLPWQILWLFVLAIPVGCVAWTVTHEDVFKELRNYCKRCSRQCRWLWQRKFFFLFTCEYCFSHYIAIIFMGLTGFHLLTDNWFGYVIGFFALVWVANLYMSLYGRLRIVMRSERAEADARQKDVTLKQNEIHQSQNPKPAAPPREFAAPEAARSGIHFDAPKEKGDSPMSSAALTNKKVAILVANGFEQSEMTEPRKALDSAGAKTELISPEPDKVKAVQHDQPGDEFKVDVPLNQANPVDYDALFLPGGVKSADHLRQITMAVDFVRSMVLLGKPIAAICHGPYTLIEAGAVKGRKLTSYPSMKTDLRNAGANWLDEPVVTDNGLVTSRNLDDIPAFNRKMIEEFSEGIHTPQSSGTGVRAAQGAA